MSGLFNTLNTANKGLMAQQTALHTTGHNISNANTPGYSRQRVDMKADLAYNYVGVGQLGTGVKMESIVRITNDYVSKQIRQENGTFERFSSKSEVIDQLEIIFNEPSTTGLNFNLGEMFDSWQELSKNPELPTSKTVIVEKSKTLAQTLNHMADQIDSLEGETLEQIEKNVLDFNNTIDKLNTLNKQIFNIAVKGHVPNDLLDQRDLLLKDLSSISDFKVSFDEFGRASVKMGNNEVLGQGQGVKYKMVANGDKIHLQGQKSDNENDNIDITEKIKAGKIRGNIEALDDIKRSKDSLDNFAKTMAEAINIIHRDGDGDWDEDSLEPDRRIDFFTFDGEKGAGTIRVNKEIVEDNSKVNAGKKGDSPEGDGSRALEIARLRNTKLVFSDNPDFSSRYDKDTMSIENDPNGVTIEGAYGNIISIIGISKNHADDMVDNQEVLLAQLEMHRESISGVSINEEVSNLIKFQSAYDANAKVISVLAEMLDTLINRTGV